MPHPSVQSKIAQRIQLTAILLFSATLMVGCGDANGVSGTVTLDSEPLANAVVQFTPQGTEGRIALAKTGADGTYRLRTSKTVSGVTPGKYRVKITTSDIQDNETKSKEKVPAKYNKESELIKEIKQGSNRIDFELTT